ncbi:estradiol 17-beta-dehydrogenase 2 [Danio aesculapii]|uniref:estradiol 17-beta-dehydrogenase 2 n=1 Tax=Danio aesculapii TaxID=1142201 RepID=UPI0024C00330|nr:estradiol 17-beta-dehydrogenase 2 [Danio aesculapii]
MEEAVEGCVGLVYDLLMVICVGFLLLRIAQGRSVRWFVLLLVSGGILSCLVHSSALKIGLMSVLCSVVHYAERDVMMTTANKAVLITGCDSGFGHELAQVLDRAGMRVFAGVLDELSPGALKLKESASVNLTVLQLDITNNTQISQTHQFIKSQTGKTGLWALVNNAGVLGYVCDGEILPMKMYKSCLDVNFLGSVVMTQTFLPLIRQCRGRVINITSMAGEVPLVGFAGYGASKAALSVYSGAIRQELSRWGVRVITVQPGAFRTNILGSSEQWERAQEQIFSGLSEEVKDSYGEEYIHSMQKRLLDMSSVSSEDKGPFLQSLKHAILSSNPKHFYYPGAGAWVLTLLYRYCPTALSDKIFSGMFLSSVQPAELAAATPH